MKCSADRAAECCGPHSSLMAYTDRFMLASESMEQSENKINQSEFDCAVPDQDFQKLWLCPNLCGDSVVSQSGFTQIWQKFVLAGHVL